MIKRWLVPALTALIVTVILGSALFFRPRQTTVNTESANQPETTAIREAENIALPSPDLRSGNSIEAVLRTRRTKRDFLEKDLSLKQVSQMLWAAQGITADWGGRTATSAKYTFPLTVFLIASNVTGLEPGQYQYIPGDRTPIHQLRPVKDVELKQALFDAVKESSFKNAPAVFVITGNMGKMAEAFGGIPHDKEVYLEAGYVAENLFLQAESLKLGMTVNSTFNSGAIKDLITIPDSDTIIFLIPFGIPKP